MKKSPRMPTRLLVSGVPGAGKSKFLDWLALKKEFKVLRVDEPADGPAIDSILGPALAGNRKGVTDAVRTVGRHVAIEYGFIPRDGDHHVTALRKVGFDTWWFDCDDYGEAFKHYMRGKETWPGAPQDFYAQRDRIIAHRPALEKLFTDRIVMSLKGPKHMEPGRIWAVIARPKR